MALAGYWHCLQHSIKQHEHYTFDRFVMAMLKQDLVLARRQEYSRSTCQIQKYWEILSLIYLPGGNILEPRFPNTFESDKYRPRFFSVLPQFLLNQYLRLPVFTCGFKITIQQYNPEFHSCLLKFSFSPHGAVLYKMRRRKEVQMDEHLTSLTLSQFL